jgi:hypothetical protein
VAAAGPGLNVVITNNDILEWRTVCTLRDQTGFTVRHFRVSAVGVPPPTLGDCAIMLNAVFAPLSKNLMSSNAAWRGVTVRRIWPLPPSPSSWDITLAGAGTQVGDAMASQTCGLISLYTAFAGRKYRGRFYQQFPSENNNDPTGVPSALYITNLQTLADALLGVRTNPNAKVGTLTPILWHRATSTFTDLLGNFARTGWATQRKRGSFGRPNPSPI